MTDVYCSCKGECGYTSIIYKDNQCMKVVDNPTDRYCTGCKTKIEGSDNA